nr:hypothetical protein QSJ49_11060 [Halobacterium salinarum]
MSSCTSTPPRGGPGQEIGLWRALTGDFATLPAVVGEATLGSLHKAIDYWATGSIQRHAYLPYFTDTADTVIAGASGVAAFAVVGFLWDRYAGAHPRGLVAFNFYCGVAALVGYPLANNFPVPWSTVHAIVPLTVPAAVGAAVVYRWGRSRLPAREPTILSEHTPMHAVRAVLAAAVLLSAVAAGGATLTETSYQAPPREPARGPRQRRDLLRTSARGPPHGRHRHRTRGRQQWLGHGRPLRRRPPSR